MPLIIVGPFFPTKRWTHIGWPPVFFLDCAVTVVFVVSYVPAVVVVVVVAVFVIVVVVVLVCPGFFQTFSC